MRAVPVVALVAALGACGSTPEPRLSAEVRQYRSDVALRTLSVTVTNDDGRPVVVERVQLAAPGLEQLPPVDVDAELPPGDRVDLPVKHGERHELELVLPTDNGLLQRLRDKDCAERALRAAVDVQLGSQWVRSRQQLRGSLVLGRRSGNEPVTVTEAGRLEQPQQRLHRLPGRRRRRAAADGSHDGRGAAG